MSPIYDGIEYEVVFSGSDELIGDRPSKITDENWKPPGRQYTKKSDYWGTGRFDKLWTFRECQDSDHDRCPATTEDGARCKCRCHGPDPSSTVSKQGEKSVRERATHKPNVTHIVVAELTHGSQEDRERKHEGAGPEPTGDVGDGAGTVGESDSGVHGVQGTGSGEVEQSGT